MVSSQKMITSSIIDEEEQDFVAQSLLSEVDEVVLKDDQELTDGPQTNMHVNSDNKILDTEIGNLLNQPSA